MRVSFTFAARSMASTVTLTLSFCWATVMFCRLTTDELIHRDQIENFDGPRHVTWNVANEHLDSFARTSRFFQHTEGFADRSARPIFSASVAHDFAAGRIFACQNGTFDILLHQRRVA